MSSACSPARLPQAWTAELDASGLPWRLERRSKHVALRVDGMVVVVLSQGTSKTKGRHEANGLATIRRFIRTRKAG